MTFFSSILICIRKTLNFRDRASRPEFWWFMLLFQICLAWAFYRDLTVPRYNPKPAFSFVVQLVFILPLAAAATRRLHDTGNSGWWLGLYLGLNLLIALLNTFLALPDPVQTLLWVAQAGLGLAMLIVLALKGDAGPNRFGPNPVSPGPETRS